MKIRPAAPQTGSGQGLRPLRAASGRAIDQAKCSRCGALMCQICRTLAPRGSGPVCPQCVDRIRSRMTSRARRKQIFNPAKHVVGVILGVTGWMVFLLTLAPYSAFNQANVSPTIVCLAYFCFIGSFLPGVAALGHSLSAIRLLRRLHEKLAASGLFTAGIAILGLLRSGSSCLTCGIFESREFVQRASVAAFARMRVYLHEPAFWRMRLILHRHL